MRKSIEHQNLTFLEALLFARQGASIAREWWNVCDMFAYFVPANSYPAQTAAEKNYFGDKLVPYREYWALKTAHGDVITWQPSGNDTNANDWMVIAWINE